MLKQLGSALLFILRFIVSIYKAGINERNILTLPLNFVKNFSPVIVWLAIFKNAGLLPNEIRPDIHVRLVYDWDIIMFSKPWFFIWLLISINFAGLWYMLVHKFSFKLNNPLEALQSSTDVECNPIELVKFIEISRNNSSDSIDTVFQTDDEDWTMTANSSDSDESMDIASGNMQSTIPINFTKITRTNQLFIIPFLFFLIWPILNLDKHFATPLSTPKDLIAWFFYVLGHITFPILTAVWLYVFHQQGALRDFSFALGLQNIMGVLTHLSFPNAPPWFIHLYGPDADADYDMPGYAAGLTRVDTALGTHLHSKGFHKSPIVFGAFPSLHSAMAFQVCLFVLYYGRSRLLQCAALAFVVVQWWATIYLDHHFRLDLIGGAMYSLFAFACIYPLILRDEAKFIKARFMGDFKKGSTFGMRVFRRNKRIQKFFDPYR